MWQTLVAMVAGGVIGLAIGCIVDALVTDDESRRRIIGVLWMLLSVGVIVFWVVRPAFQVARE